MASDEDLIRLRRAIAGGYNNAAEYSEIERKACYYTVRDDERFFVKSIGHKAHVVSACSGHGFKLQPLITEKLADAIDGKRTLDDVQCWACGADVER
ncbi:hypothetical protein EN809_017045 [Mesorhizobium sp. M2E.F.Ca.ET.166.01.1.1]|nr:hypothetical protein EN809_017045 [Mesorhizobium sp. M2E.F.Ca.ET.166.01.1.1]TGV99411.1 hypothetical protein EN797_024210 [Mesorhizobium sp. M2E.F.Ca.ET.154.01.1.1]